MLYHTRKRKKKRKRDRKIVTETSYDVITLKHMSTLTPLPFSVTQTLPFPVHILSLIVSPPPPPLMTTWPQLHYRHRHILHTTITIHQVTDTARLFNSVFYIFPIDTQLVYDRVNKFYSSPLIGMKCRQHRWSDD